MTEQATNLVDALRTVAKEHQYDVFTPLTIGKTKRIVTVRIKPDGTVNEILVRGTRNFGLLSINEFVEATALSDDEISSPEVNLLAEIPAETTT